MADHSNENVSQEAEVIEIPDNASDYGLTLKDIPHKVLGANRVALFIVAIFGVTLVLILSVGFCLIRAAHFPDSKSLVADALIPFIERVGTFSTSVFGPLLAFILGYYFGEKAQS